MTGNIEYSDLILTNTLLISILVSWYHLHYWSVFLLKLNPFSLQTSIHWMYFYWKIGYGGGVVPNQNHPTRRPYHWLLFHLWQQAMRYHGDQSRQLWNLAYSQRCDREVRDTFLFLQIIQNKWYLTWLSGIFLIQFAYKTNVQNFLSYLQDIL